MAGFFIITVYIMCRFNSKLAPAGGETSLKQKLMGLTGVVEMVVLFGLVIGGLFAGFFSPTQAGAAGTAGAIVIGVIQKAIVL